MISCSTKSSGAQCAAADQSDARADRAAFVFEHPKGDVDD